MMQSSYGRIINNFVARASRNPGQAKLFSCESRIARLYPCCRAGVWQIGITCQRHCARLHPNRIDPALPNSEAITEEPWRLRRSKRPGEIDDIAMQRFFPPPSGWIHNGGSFACDWRTKYG